MIVPHNALYRSDKPTDAKKKVLYEILARFEAKEEAEVSKKEARNKLETSTRNHCKPKKQTKNYVKKQPQKSAKLSPKLLQNKPKIRAKTCYKMSQKRVRTEP